MNLTEVRTVVTVADCGSFTGAASRLRFAQSTVSQQVRALERVLGVVLVERSVSYGEPRLTPAGRAFLDYAKAILATADAGRAVAVATQRDVRRGVERGADAFPGGRR